MLKTLSILLSTHSTEYFFYDRSPYGSRDSVREAPKKFQVSTDRAEGRDQIVTPSRVREVKMMYDIRMMP